METITQDDIAETVAGILDKREAWDAVHRDKHIKMAIVAMFGWHWIAYKDDVNLAALWGPWGREADAQDQMGSEIIARFKGKETHD